MSNQQQPAKSNAFVVPVLIVVMLSVAVLAAIFVGNEGTDIAASNRARAQYIEVHGCVVADVQGRQASRYRCEKPTAGTYIDAYQLQEFADKEFKPAH
jgi:hypothetical protein